LIFKIFIDFNEGIRRFTPYGRRPIRVIVPNVEQSRHSSTTIENEVNIINENNIDFTEENNDSADSLQNDIVLCNENINDN